MRGRKLYAVRPGTLTFFAFLAWAIAPLAWADTVSLAPSKDNTLFEDDEGLLSNGAGRYAFAGRTAMNSAFLRRGLFAFDIAGAIPAGSTITSAALTVRVSKTIANAPVLALRKLLADWGEGASTTGTGAGGGGAPAEIGDATWLDRFYSGDPNQPNLPWSTPGGAPGVDFSGTDSAALTVGLADEDYTWGSNPQMVADVQGWLDTPASNFGWLVLGDETQSTTAVRLDTREHPTASVRPRLVIEYNPIGGTSTPTSTPTSTWTGTETPSSTRTSTPTVTTTGSQSPVATPTVTATGPQSLSPTATATGPQGPSPSPTVTAPGSPGPSATPTSPVQVAGTPRGVGWPGLAFVLLAGFALLRPRSRRPN